MDKSPDAFRTISEVATDLDLPQHVLRFWETRFVQIKPLKRGGGRRYYRPDDIDLLKGIRHLLYGEGYTIRGVQRILKEQGVRFVTEVWREGAPQPPPAGSRWEAEPPLDRGAAEDWSTDAEIETEEQPTFDEPADRPPEPEDGWSAADEQEPAWEPPADTVPSEPPPASVAAPVPHAPFAIGRATPLDPNFHARNDAVVAPDFAPRSDSTDEAEEERSAQAMAQRFAPRSPPPGETAPRRAERIAGFTAAPARPSVAPEVTPLRPGLAPSVQADAPVRSPRLPAGLRSTTAVPPEPQRSGIGHLFDRLRSAPASISGAGHASPPPPRAPQSLSRDEIRRLQSTLFELLECKRLLDQIR